MTSQLRWSLRWRLSVLWVLEWGITGTILTYLPLYLTESGLSAQQQGQLLATTAIGLWVAPFVVGQVVDRWLASEKYLAISHFIGALTLASLPFATELYKETGKNFGLLMALFGLYAVAYFPTLPVATSLTFRHLENPDAQFGKVRIWGTLGWMLAGLGLSLWLGRADALDWLATNFPAWTSTHAGLTTIVGWLPEPTSSDCFRIAALLSFALSSFCIFLPATPPLQTARGGITAIEILGLFRDRTFSFLIVISFLLALVVPLYTLEVPRLLAQLGFGNDWVPAVMLVGQISEFPALLLLSLCLKRLGLKQTFALGMGAWLVRYVFFAFEDPLWLILAGLALHGVCHVFLIIVIQLFVDSRCRADLRATAQNLFAFITMGIGMPLGALLAGGWSELCESITDDGARTNYHLLFAVPAAIILVLLVVYQRGFRMDGSPSKPEAQHDDEALATNRESEVRESQVSAES